MMEIVNGIPVVDFGALSIQRLARPEAKSEEIQELARNLIQGFTTAGFVYLKNHGISQNQVDKVMLNCEQFFALDPNIKSKYKLLEKTGPLDGWSSLGSYSVDPEKPPDLRETFGIGSIRENNFTFWPDEEIPPFKPTMETFFNQCELLGKSMLTAIAIGLGMEPDVFQQFYQHTGTKEAVTFLRLIMYPRIANYAVKSGQIRCGKHTDFGGITFIFQDDIGGLEMRSNKGDFIPATPMKDTVIVLIDDLMQRWTTDRLKATVHRVTIPDEERKRTKSRQSVVFFYYPDNNAVIRCLDGSDKYQPVKAREYLDTMFATIYK